MKKRLFIASFLILALFKVSAQDMDSWLDNATEETSNLTTATFKATRIINGHSIERMKYGQLDFRIHHRFGYLNTGYDNFYGLDQAITFLGLEYGINDRLMAGIGRSAYQNTVSGFLKYALLQQQTGEKSMPLSLVLFSSMEARTDDYEDPTKTNYTSSRFSYVYQALVARKFNEQFSLQFMPTMVHKNLVKETVDPNDIFALGVGGRVKITKRFSFNGEYYFQLNPTKLADGSKTPNSLSLGFDIETGGHVFQLFVSNSQQTQEKGFITETAGRWKDGDILFGFNISRAFSIANKHSK